MAIFHTFMDFVGGIELSKRVFLVDVHVEADEFCIHFVEVCFVF